MTWLVLKAPLPLVSVPAMIWIVIHDRVRLAGDAGATFWDVLPSMPRFVLMPLMIRSGFGFWTSLLAGSALTFVLYLGKITLGARFGLKLQPGQCLR